MYCNAQSSTGELLPEREANVFAAALLMPHRQIQEAVTNLSPQEEGNIVPFYTLNSM